MPTHFIQHVANVHSSLVLPMTCGNVELEIQKAETLLGPLGLIRTLRALCNREHKNGSCLLWLRHLLCSSFSQDPDKKQSTKKNCMEMAAGGCGAPGNGGNGVRDSEGTAKNTVMFLLPSVPCHLRKGTGQGVDIEKRALPQDAGVPVRGGESLHPSLGAGMPGQRRWQLQEGR